MTLIPAKKIIEEENAFQAYMKKYGVRDPDNPRHFYNYRAAHRARVMPKQWKDLPEEDKQEDLEQIRKGLRPPIPENHYMWPDEYKLEEHPIPSKNKTLAKIIVMKSRKRLRTNSLR